MAPAAEQALGKALAAACRQALDGGDFVLEAGRTAYLTNIPGVQARRVILAAAPDASLAAARKALAAGLGLLDKLGVRHLAVASAGAAAADAALAAALPPVADEAAYVYRATKPSAKPGPALARVSLVCEDAARAAADAALARGRAVAAGIALARECANRPGNHCTPSYLAEQAREIARARRVTVQVLERKDAERLGMGCFLAVARGSDEPLKFIVLRYQGAAKGDAPVVLVGKGITFDSGGISIKPAELMDEMKFDMGGAASVLGAFRALADLQPRINVVGLIPACENLPSGRATKPGDVVTSMSGQTVEILNTDAEGRLILCDALSYAERFAPAAVIDVATLTGACVIALGHVRSGLFSADDALAGELLAAGEAAGDPAWRMPLDDDYAKGLETRFADVANVAGRPGGSITAAKFLQRFAGKLPWAHLDIAGTAWKTGTAKGATGRPVGLLMQFLLGRAGG
ncbi:MAG: leucyl aminopeptidase [Burkholderiales bacterium]|nr:leucyl aminopeptidase [Burkholderiales bacterium]